MICLLTGLAATIRAASHWSVNPYDFQYDMTVYLQLSATNQDIYEVAAFCGDECRGVGSLMTVGSDSKVFYMRIRSNVAKNEQITFRIYDTVNGKEVQTDGFGVADMQVAVRLRWKSGIYFRIVFPVLDVFFDNLLNEIHILRF